MPPINRRSFLKAGSCSVLPAIIPLGGLLAAETAAQENPSPANDPKVLFYGDGKMFSPGEYISQLQSINNKTAIEQDFYGEGGAVTALEKKFMEITGKEAAIYMPTGTMANQLAISVLSASDTKVFVQETSHVFRDEADAAQSVFQKRLIPLAKGEGWFTAKQLEEAVNYHQQEEVFHSGMGCVSIENPVRRADGRMIPLEEIKLISAYCRKQGIRLHLDGARIYMASTWSGITIKEYADYFDTVYISLYKYLGAAGGAILCGDKAVISRMKHLVKVHGGTVFGNWANAAMALHQLETIGDKLTRARKKADELFTRLNQLPGISIQPLSAGTNIYSLRLGDTIQPAKMGKTLYQEHGIVLPRAGDKRELKISVNETLLNLDNETILRAFKAATS